METTKKKQGPKLGHQFKTVGAYQQYAFYCEITENPIPYNTWRTLAKRYGELVREDVIFKNKILYLPFGLGYFYIRWRKTRAVLDEDFNIITCTAGTDWKATNEQRAQDPEFRGRVYYTNSHTEGRAAALAWSRTMSVVRAIKAYRFIPVRSCARALATEIKAGRIC